MPATPYVSAAAFRAHPTYLDTDGLRPGDPDPDAQTAALVTLLTEASSWADGICDQPLGAHIRTQRRRAVVDRAGNLKFHADHTPVISVISVGYGLTPVALTTLDGAGAWVEDDANIIMPIGGMNTAWSGSLQFGLPLSGDVFVQSVTAAGFVATVLAADSAAGSSTLTVLDPTGIIPGGEYRIWQPGAEETVTVSPTWVPPAATAPPVPTPVDLAAPTAFAHEAAHDFSGMPAEMRNAIVQYVTATLMRPDSTAEDEFPNTGLGSDTRRNDPRNGSGLIAAAARTLASYGRVR
ncbi:hypothetical protein ACIO6U_02565 [Streptomyces sp. NPDC087422]|uniref:hypothetical protein n=1 Tax=Streptomyces sp. NPDC087422 TaxID=3365786 RepID=UPI0037F4A943